jgi:hypothetical protein
MLARRAVFGRIQIEEACMSYKGHIRNGVVVLDEPVELPDGAEVRVEAVVRADDINSLREGLLKFAGTINDLPADMARNHDHYLYGTPRK